MFSVFSYSSLSTINKIYLWIFIIIISLYLSLIFVDRVLHASYYVDTVASVARKKCRKHYTKYRTEKRCKVTYIYEFNFDQAKQYSSEEKLIKALKRKAISHAINYADLNRRFPVYELDENMRFFFGVESVGERTFQAMEINQKITIRYRQDKPWKSYISY